jgi:diketogulonate reductase-like aldo/keto reductase
MDSQLSMRATIQLNNGRDMPVLGLGVWSMAEGAETEQAVLWALEAGYRLIDTAKIYGNEASVGRAVRKSGIAREEIFVTTKLWPSDFFRVRAALQKSLDQLGLAYIDLYLIHWPIPLVRSGIWKDFEKIYAAGLVRSIGVSNYSVKQLAALATATSPRLSIKCCFIPFPTGRSCSITASQRILLLKPTARWPGAGN